MDELVDAVRVALGPLIIQRVCGPKEALSVITLDPALEQVIMQNARAAGSGASIIEPRIPDQRVASTSSVASS